MKARRKILQFIAITTIILGFPSATAVDGVFEVNGDFGTESNHTFTFFNKTSVSSANTTIISPEEGQRKKKLSVAGNKLEAEVDGDFLDDNGVYSFKFDIDGEKTPKTGYYSLIIGKGDQNKYSSFLNLSGSRPTESPYCADKEDFTCEYEDYQASMMMKAAESYYVTDNPKFREEALNFSLKSYGSDLNSQIACPHNLNRPNRSPQFDCFSADEDPSGSERQGSLIESLWTVYSITGNETVRELALNYTEEEFGNDNCDVWNNSFDCGSAKDEGYLANGFWTAYGITNRDDFREIAENLTSSNQSHPRMAEAFAKGYRLTGNETYQAELEKMFDQEYLECQDSNCSDIRNLQLSLAGFEGYRATGHHGYYAAAKLSQPRICSSSECELPEEQGLSTLVSSGIYKSFRGENKSFYNPKILDNPSNEKPLSVGIDFSGIINNSKAYLYSPKMEILDTCSIGLGSSSCTFDHEWQDQQVYYINFSSDELGYPKGKGIPITYTQKDQDLEADALRLARGSPETRCDPYSGDFSCVVIDERYQSNYISGFSEAYSYTANSTYLNFAEILSTPPYHYEQNASGSEAELCVPDKDLNGGVYRCETFDNVLAGQRQGSHISALFNSYSQTGNNSIKEIAENYASSSVVDTNDCNVWDGDFECRTETEAESQSSMIDGYWTAYRVTGNETYRSIAKNLTTEGLNQPESYGLARSLWQSYTWTGNETYKENAENMTESLSGNWSCDDCDINEYIEKGNMLIKSYRASGNETYVSDIENHLENRTEFECIATGNCSNPKTQGKAISFMTRSAYNFPLSIAIERSIDISENEITVGDSVQTVCEAENVLPNSTIFDLELNVSSGPEFGNDYYNYSIGDMEYNESNTTTNEFTSVNTGSSEISCEYTSPDFVRTSTETIEIVKEDSSGSDGGNDQENDQDNSGDSEDSSGGGGGNSGPGGSVPEGPSYEPKEIEYEYSRREYNFTELDLDKEYSHYKIYSDSCISARRILKKNQTKLRINQSCKNNTNLIVRDRFNDTTQQEIYSNITESEKEIVYPFNSKESEWSKPEIAIFYEENLKIDTSIGDNNYVESNSGSYILELNLNRPQECKVSRNQTLVSQQSSINQKHNISLEEGNNSIAVDCSSQPQNFTVNYISDEKDQKLTSILTLLIAGGLTLVLSSTAVYYRERIIGFGRIKIFDFYFNRVISCVDKGNTEAAVKNYKKMNKYCNLPESESNLDVQEGMKLYMMIDLISDAGMELGDAELVGDVKTSLGKYLNQNPDDPLVRHIENKVNTEM